jgi:[protein-PII] uridylyltransferase
MVALLGCGAAAVPMLETLDQIGVLERYLPEWVAVRSLPQRNAYHRYTVDRHLLEAAAAAAPLVRDVHRPDLLLVGALLHDIGKGSDGDHTVAGEHIVAGIAERMGFAASDVNELVRMVRHHLLLGDIAMRRDLDDPATIVSVAAQVGTTELLDLLAALTGADGAATGPAAWGPWKAGLVDELVTRTRALLAGEEPGNGSDRPISKANRALMDAGSLRLVPEGATVTVVAPDQHGLLATVAGTLAVHRLRIRAAVAGGDGQMACDVFELDPDWPHPPDWWRIEVDLGKALAGELAIDELLARRVAARSGGRVAAAEPAHPRVIVDNGASAAATLLEVRAPDGVGVLYRIAGAIAACGFDIASAKLLTLGHEVVDTFYVVESSTGGRSTDPAALRRLEDEILDALRRAW